MKRMSVFGEEGEAEEVVQEGSKGASIPSGMDYPGVIQLTGRAENYTIGGTGLLRAEPYLREGSGFYIRNSWQVRRPLPPPLFPLLFLHPPPLRT